ncbi:MAG: hypothetical protein ABS949_05865 [Solibacillus sp.]
MEALIMMIVLGLISSFFGKKDQQKKKSRPMPPFNNPTAPQKPAPQQKERPKSLEDFANEIFGQLNEKKAETKPVSVEAPTPVFEPVVEKVRERREVMRTSSGRPPLEERPLVKKLKQEPAFQTVPKNQKQMMQAVVMAEILGKPKARR